MSDEPSVQPPDRVFVTRQPEKPIVAASYLEMRHTLNPPVVTVFGAGVAGLTAAHELVERGFRVFVVESERDPEKAGFDPLVGGMAASQFGRARATLEELHPDLFEKDRRTPKQDPISRGLFFLFLHNRSFWLQTEKPFLIPPLDHTNYKSADWWLELERERSLRRNRWLWDLLVRPAIGLLTRESEQELRGPFGYDEEHPGANAHRDQAIKELSAAYQDLRTVAEQDVGSKACSLVNALLARFKIRADIAEAFKAAVDTDRGHKGTIAAAFEREFLFIQATPCWVPLDDYQQATFVERNLPPPSVQPAQELVFLTNDVRLELEAKGFKHNVKFMPPRPYTVDEALKKDRKVGKYWIEFEIVEERLPGEHGYRFFPAFYRHLDDTLARINRSATDPYAGTVLDNLRPTPMQGIGLGKGEGPPQTTSAGKVLINYERRRPTSLTELHENTVGFFRKLGGTDEDALRLNLKLMQFLTSSAARRTKEYEKKTWAQFIGLDRFSKHLGDQLRAAAQVLNAFSAEEADAHTYGNVALALLLDNMTDGSRSDRTLNGPSSENWFNHWRRYLQEQGVQFVCGRLAGARLVENPKDKTQECVPELAFDFELNEGQLAQKKAIERSDFFVSALSAKATKHLVDSLPAGDVVAAPDFERFRHFWHYAGLDHEGQQTAVGSDKFPSPLRDMVGMQFFFDSKTKVGNGHVYYPYSEWGLSTISQSEFWVRKTSAREGFLGILSIDLCRVDRKPGQGRRGFWQTLELNPDAQPYQADKTPIDRRDITKAIRLEHEWEGKLRAAVEVWRQIDKRLAPARQRMVRQDDSTPGLEFPRFVHLDWSIESRPKGFQWVNRSRFLAVTPETWKSRPGLGNDGKLDYRLNYGRWVMCGTFAATYTRMTTMEAANESARHAVRPILERLTAPDAQWRKVTITKESEASEESTTGEESNAREESSATDLWVYLGGNQSYNGASNAQMYDPPEIWPLEQREPRDLEKLKDLDEELLKRGLPHLFEIVQLERVLLHQFEAGRLARDLGIGRKGDGSPVEAGVPAGQTTPLRPIWEALRALQSRQEAGDFPISPTVIEELERLEEKLRNFLSQTAGRP